MATAATAGAAAAVDDVEGSNGVDANVAAAVAEGTAARDGADRAAEAVAAPLKAANDVIHSNSNSNNNMNESTCTENAKLEEAATSDKIATKKANSSNNGSKRAVRLTMAGMIMASEGPASNTHEDNNNNNNNNDGGRDSKPPGNNTATTTESATTLTPSKRDADGSVPSENNTTKPSTNISDGNGISSRRNTATTATTMATSTNASSQGDPDTANQATATMPAPATSSSTSILHSQRLRPRHAANGSARGSRRTVDSNNSASAGACDDSARNNSGSDSNRTSFEKTKVSHSSLRSSDASSSSNNNAAATTQPTHHRIRLTKAPRHSGGSTGHQREERLTPPTMYRAATAPNAVPSIRDRARATVAARVNMLGGAADITANRTSNGSADGNHNRHRNQQQQQQQHGRTAASAASQSAYDRKMAADAAATTPRQQRQGSQLNVADKDVDSDDEELIQMNEASMPPSTPGATAVGGDRNSSSSNNNAATPAASTAASSLNDYIAQNNHSKKPRHQNDMRPTQAEHDYTEESVSDLGDSVDLMDAPDDENQQQGIGGAAATTTNNNNNNQQQQGAPSNHNNRAPAAPEPGAIRVVNENAPAVPSRSTSFFSRIISNDSTKVSAVADDNANEGGLVAATAVSRDDIEQQVRDEFLHNVVAATRVETVTMDEEQSPHTKRSGSATYTTHGSQQPHQNQHGAHDRANGNQNSGKGSDFCCCRTWCGCGMSVIIAFTCCGCIFLIGIIVGTGVAIASSLADDIADDIANIANTSIAPSATLAPSADLPTDDSHDDPADSFTLEVLRGLLLSVSPNPDALFVPGTPQYRAWKWTGESARVVYTEQVARNETPTVFDDPNLLDDLVQRFALATLYFATDGDNWRRSNNWLSQESICNWFPGRTNQCILEDNGAFYIRTLDLSDNNLNGVLVPELAILTDLEFINLSDNHFGVVADGVPESIPDAGVDGGGVDGVGGDGGLAASANTTESEIDDEAAPTRKLQYLRQLQTTDDTPSNGTDEEDITNTTDGSDTDDEASSPATPQAFPSAFGDLKKLSEFSCNDCNLGGTIPMAVGGMISLTQLRLRGNSIFGSLPFTMGNLAKLQDIDVSSNELTGTLPPILGSLFELETFNIGSNRLEGDIPAQYSLLRSIDALRMDENNFTGNSIEDVICGSSLGDNITILFADCQEISCSCCTRCCVDDRRPNRCRPNVVLP
mmetsp:Transcript_17476/g.49352  ORF Transcript_17476/g.49352 Transcript_17476/m.49352 type:complete len:1205 (+) Transcript_17476:183-3797(+)